MHADVFSWRALDPAACGSQQSFPNKECSELNISPSSGGEIKLVISHLSVGSAFVSAVHNVIFSYFFSEMGLLRGQRADSHPCFCCRSRILTNIIQIPLG